MTNRSMRVPVGCPHSKASIVASDARVRDHGGSSVAGSVRWCPECGAIRSETFATEGRVLGDWHRVGNASVVAASLQAVRQEEFGKAQAAAREQQAAQTEEQREQERLDAAQEAEHAAE